MDENKFLVKFKNPYVFEGGTFNEVDLSGIESLTVKDLIEADRQFMGSGQVATVNEMSTGYAAIIASKVTGKIVKFFEGLPAGEGIKIKNIVSSFFYE